MHDNLTPEQRQSVAWDDVLTAHLMLAGAVDQMLEAKGAVHLLDWITKVHQRRNELKIAQQEYWNALADAS